MELEQVLIEIRHLLDIGKTGIASDVLFDFVMSSLGHPVPITLPSNHCCLPPKIVVSRLKKTLEKLLKDNPGRSSPDKYASFFPSAADLELISQTAANYEERQKVYLPGEELFVDQSSSIKCQMPICQDELTLSKKNSSSIAKNNNHKSQQALFETEIKQGHDIVTESVIARSQPGSIIFSDAENRSDVYEDIVTLYPQEDHTAIYDDLDLSLTDEELFYDDEADDREDLCDVDYDIHLPREERAWQIAYDLGSRYGWSLEGIALLQEIFIERGWSQARLAIDGLIRGGMTAEQLELAKELKETWDQRTELMIGFYRSRKDTSDYAYQKSKVLSWVVAYEIISSFYGCNSFDEIEQFIEEAMDYWYSNGRLRHDYRSFLEYLRSSINHSECLSANLIDIEPEEETYQESADYLFNVMKTEMPEIFYCFDWQPELWRQPIQ